MDVRSETETPRRELATPYRWFRIFRAASRLRAR